MPININNTHWMLVIVYPKKNIIASYDSINGNNEEVVNNVLKLLHFLVKKDSDEEDCFKEWDFLVIDGPQQNNAFDCGVFMCIFALFVMKGENVIEGNASNLFSWLVIPDLRKTMASCILDGKIDFY